MIIQYQSSVIFVKDIATSRHFYEELLGQEVELDHGPNVAFKGGFAIWQVDHASEMIFEGPANGDGPLGRKNLEIYFESPDLQAAWDCLMAAGVRSVHPLREHPWGQCVFRVYDPDGHIVEIGEFMPTVIQRFLAQGMSLEAVAEKTSMPLEIVQQIATT